MITTRDSIIGGARKGGRAYTAVSDKSPRIRMVTPGDNFTVYGDVFILVDAVSEHNSAGTLSVEITVDGAVPMKALYSPVSGLYGAIWDSSSTRSGTMHTLRAKVCDSTGKSGSTLTLVSVG
jgi:hypothetical protein